MARRHIITRIAAAPVVAALLFLTCACAGKLCERYKIQVWFINGELEKAERKRP
ncbi:MAG: hypothetical protein PHG54_04145 [Smithellaceae bacterium]|nr:hypothetical protein [Syntrophaceae bacterium]MDD4240598.1 hypothetical protein [Smithellaceae bacterium]